ncbi:MAG: hypothetical protein HY917_03040 [Candidatus Diapherotrites archaeon]|nr:hypothetical protein [Candidatus Diapherotrites archaeon]
MKENRVASFAETVFSKFKKNAGAQLPPVSLLPVNESLSPNQPQTTPVPADPSSVISLALRQKAGGKISEVQLNEMEEKINELLKRHSLAPQKAIDEIHHLDPQRLPESFNELVTLLRRECTLHPHHRELPPKPLIRPETVVPVQSPLPSQPASLNENLIVTAFDRGLSLIEQKGRIPFSEFCKELGLGKEQTQELLKILENEKLIVLHYPPIGEMVAQDIHWSSKKESNSKGDMHEGQTH